MEHPDDALEENENPILGKSLAAFINRQSNLLAEEEGGNDKSEDPASTASAAAAAATSSTGPNKPEKYVAYRGGNSSSMAAADGTESTLRVWNLSKLTTEDDLYELFGRFGRIHRVYLPRIEDNKTGEKVARGFAYIAFVRRDDAVLAMEKLEGYGYDHLIIKIEWAKSGYNNGGGGTGGNVYRSGYGKQLAQDTTEKAVFTSTKNNNNNN
jgi:translation initiation factor 3 subunit G